MGGMVHNAMVVFCSFVYDIDLSQRHTSYRTIETSIQHHPRPVSPLGKGHHLHVSLNA